MFGAKTSYALRPDKDERGHRMYTYHPFALGLWGIFVGVAMMTGGVWALIGRGSAIALEVRILIWLLALAGLWLAVVGLRLACRRETVVFHSRAKTIEWKVSGILDNKEERVPYHKAQLRVHKCSVYTRRLTSAGWALTLDLPQSQIILAWSGSFNDIEDTARILSEATHMEWGRAATPTARWLL